MASPSEVLKDVEAYVFDVFGTVVNWHGNITKQLAAAAPEGVDEGTGTPLPTNGGQHSLNIGGEGTTNMDVVHRQTLDNLLTTPRWKHLASHWDDAKRHELVMSWHKAQGWPDAPKGLYALKQNAIVVALSNGNLRFLVDLAKNGDLPWDAVFSVEFFGTCKPNPQVYLGALHHLNLPGEKCAMVASHLWDLKAAAEHAGMKTIYVPRLTEDLEDREGVKSKAGGGEVDIVVNSFEELAALL
ncbi:hypothetical protein GSI_03596 [Ganoderma sinense ZZ0214-1]|uniref:Haloacid dehalogenase n=1 Tax=Ganoderma sinense ZZ0214-1 TaxID=1077348 RepID=A0A2G8SJH5_9APHY|nr:hypothetical protein GSI_03596 [Ganoderma sinense ZZ0214-1]